jgi:hypothetical protein
VILVGAAGLVLTGCSSTNAGGPTGQSGHATSTTAPHFRSELPGAEALANGQEYLIVAGKRIILPTEDGGAPVDPVRSMGQNVLLTSRGPWPGQLFARSSSPVVFTNLTNVTVKITFVSSPVKPFVVPPTGGMRSWKPSGLISVAYEDSRGGQGNLTVDAFPS